MKLASNLLRCGVLAIAGGYRSFSRSAGPELAFCAGSCPNRGVSGVFGFKGR